eukprot:CAMPEP_0203684226 /NCGR_PEP_ID=MMETSP0090-20130426/47926_1 /ASSEMBLY_ACC=CAM_ASM_001088 /TAXON_ID=426623 /ORGANISM="Chaetoceros affinis, Strain CCMP159" /LENGTH=706 /DNA_ID=CAMNT_0050553393 /DNA_START=130 /DNA_END=2250 /DNA_ORIENTATION=+
MITQNGAARRYSTDVRTKNTSTVISASSLANRNPFRDNYSYSYSNSNRLFHQSRALSGRTEGLKDNSAADGDYASTSTSTSELSKDKNAHEIIHRLVTIAKPEMKLIIASAATLGLTSSITLLLPYACGQVLDVAILEASGQGTGTVSPYSVALGLFGLTGISGLGFYARSLMLNIAGNRIVSRMRRQLFASIVSQDAAFFDRARSGDLISRLVNDTYLMKSAVTTEAVAGLRAVVMSAGSTVLLFQTSPSLAVVSLLSIPPVFLGSRMLGQQIKSKQKEVQELHGRATTVAEETILGIRTVQQFVNEGYEHNRYSVAVNKAHNTEIDVGRSKAILDGAVHVAANGAILGTLGYGATLVLANEMTAGDLTGFLMYSLLMAGNISSLSSTYADMMKSFAAAGRTFEIIDRVPGIPSSFRQGALINNDDTTTTESYFSIEKLGDNHPMAIQFENVHFAYPQRKEISILGPNFNLTVNPGEVVAIVGGSGSGKSTVAAILTRLYNIDTDFDTDTDTDTNTARKKKGKVSIGGIDISDVNSACLRKTIGVVAQEPLLFAGSIADNIRYGRLDASEDEVARAAKAAHVLEFTDNLPLGMETQVGSRGLQLSGGQKQRVAIARMILKDPPIIVLDEATSSLDSESEYHVHQALRSIMKGRTVISIAHRLSTIQEADSIAVLKDGVITETGTFQELVAKENGAFQKLMQQQIQ